jgi:hypothetical protein
MLDVDVLAQARDLAAKCADAGVWSVPDADLVAVLDTAHALEQLAATVKLHAVREVDGRGIPAAQHATSVAVWLRQRLRVDIHTARRMVELARQVERRPVGW